MSDPPLGDVDIGEAYARGAVARRDRLLPCGTHGGENPYHHAEQTQQWLAWRSGWNDQGVWMAQRGMTPTSLFPVKL